MDAKSVSRAIQSVDIAFSSIEFLYRINRDLGVPGAQEIFASKFELKGIVLEGKKMSLQEAEYFLWNHLNGTLCVFWIALDEALEDAFGTKQPNRNLPIDDFRAVIFMFRCAFSHEVSQPVWSVKKEAYRRRPYRLPLPLKYRSLGFDEFYFDFEKLNGQEVKIEDFRHFPGMFVFWKMAQAFLEERLLALNESERVCCITLF